MKGAHFQKLPIEPLSPNLYIWGALPQSTHYNLSAFYLTSCILIATNLFANTRLGNHRAGEGQMGQQVELVELYDVGGHGAEVGAHLLEDGVLGEEAPLVGPFALRHQ